MQELHPVEYKEFQEKYKFLKEENRAKYGELKSKWLDRHIESITKFEFS